MNLEDEVMELLRLMPSPAGIPTLMPVELTRAWAKHLVECGVLTRDYLTAVAVDGVVRLEDVPDRRKRLSAPLRGPRNPWNNSARWVDVNEPDPPPGNIPDIRDLHPNEQQGLLEQFRAAGMIPPPPPEPPLAEEDDE